MSVLGAVFVVPGLALPCCSAEVGQVCCEFCGAVRTLGFTNDVVWARVATLCFGLQTTPPEAENSVPSGACFRICYCASAFLLTHP